MPDERMTRGEVVSLHRSAACTDGLPKHQALRVLTELEQVLAEREELLRIVDELSQGPWPQTRRLLLDLHHVLHPPRGA